jgi:predicted nucleic acid-binding protein
MLTYADGSALSRYLAGDVESAFWMRWADSHSEELVTSPLALTELRRAADALGAVARETARNVSTSLTLVRFFDQGLKVAAMTTSVLPPFAALHLGIAVGHPDVEAIATYDALLAQVATLYRLGVVAPGRKDGWWES